MFEETHRLAWTVWATASKGMEKPTHKQQKQWLMPLQFRMLSLWMTIQKDFWMSWSSTAIPKTHRQHLGSSTDSNKLPTIPENVQSFAICYIQMGSWQWHSRKQDWRERLGRAQGSIPKLLQRQRNRQAQLLQPAQNEAEPDWKSLRLLDQGSTSHGSH